MAVGGIQTERGRLRPYASNQQPWSYPIAAGSGRLLERIWQTSCAWLQYPESWGVDGRSEPARRRRAWAGELLAKMPPAHVVQEPDSDAERLTYFDHVRRRDFEPARITATPAGATWELSRVAITGYGMGVIERIETFLRVQGRNPSTGAAVGPQFELKEGVSLGGPAVAPGTYASPFPFPIPHPTAGLSALGVRFSLRVQRISESESGYPPILSGGLQGPPPGMVWPEWPSDWSDMRYQWGSPSHRNLKFIAGGHSLVRLFVTLTATSGTWTVSGAGRLSGYRQQAGRRGAALENATRRGT